METLSSAQPTSLSLFTLFSSISAAPCAPSFLCAVYLRWWVSVAATCHRSCHIGFAALLGRPKGPLPPALRPPQSPARFPAVIISAIARSSRPPSTAQSSRSLTRCTETPYETVCSKRPVYVRAVNRRNCVHIMQWVPLFATGAALAHQTGVFAVESLKAIYDPTNADAVAAVGELSSLNSLENMKNCMMADQRGRSILKHQPVVGDEVLEFSRGLAPSTFGFRYAAYMDRNHFLPSGRAAVKHIADPTLAYVMMRHRQCHDFLHVITGCGRSVEEELAVKVFEWKHTGLPLGLLSLLGGASRLSATQLAHMRLFWEWASHNAPCSRHDKPAVPMYLNVPWEDMLAKEYDEVAAYTGITPLPAFLKKHQKQ